MTHNRVPLDDLKVLEHILTNAGTLLLDFDGPVCSVFAGFPAPVVAEQLREILLDGGHADLPPEVEKTEDPFDVLYFAASISADDARYTEAALRAYEVQAVSNAEPAAGSHELIRAWHRSGRSLAVVSNNSASAVEAYLNRYDLLSCVSYISARTKPDPSLLKPNPFLLYQAIEALGATEDKCVLIGDSLTDIQAARQAGVLVIAYANKPEKVRAFNEANADLIATKINRFAEIIIAM